MAVLRAEMAWSVSIAVLRIHICAFRKKSVDNMIISTDAGNMQRCTHCLGSAIQITAILGEYFD